MDVVEALPEDDRSVAGAGASPGRRHSGEDGAGAADEDAVALLRDAGAPSHPTRPRSHRRLAEAIACLLSVAVIWVGASVLVQYLFSSLDLKLPFFLTYVCVSEFVVLLPLRWARERWLPPARRAPRTDWRAAARAAAIVCPVWFAAQGSYNWSLAGTSVSSSTVLSTTSCVWTLLIGVVVFRHERFTWVKLAGVLVTVAGGALVSFGDTSRGNSDGGGGGPPTAWADALALFSAACYGLYTALIKRTVPGDGSVSMSVFFGFLGLFNSLLLLPVVLALNAAGVERLARVTPAFMALILVKGLFDNVISDLLWARAIVLSSATMATVGLALTIPLAMLADLAVHGAVPGQWLALGSTAVVAGFLLTTVSAGGDAAAADAAAATGGRGIVGDNRNGTSGAGVGDAEAVGIVNRAAESAPGRIDGGSGRGGGGRGGGGGGGVDKQHVLVSGGRPESQSSDAES